MYDTLLKVINTVIHHNPVSTIVSSQTDVYLQLIIRNRHLRINCQGSVMTAADKSSAAQTTFHTTTEVQTQINDVQSQLNMWTVTQTSHVTSLGFHIWSRQTKQVDL